MNPRNSSVRSAGWAALLVVAAVMLGCGGGSSGTTTGPVVTTFTPASPIVDGSLAMRAGNSAGSTITIKVSATQIPSFFGAAFYVTYNPSVLRFNGMDSAGSFLLAGVSASDVVFLADNATPGTVKVVASRLDPTTAPAVPVTTTAVMGGGAAFFAALALLPTLREMPEPTRSAIRSAVADRWRPVLSASIGLLLLSGIANFVLFQGPAHAGQALYLALFGVKVLAALGVFFLASALMGRSEALQPVRDNGALWTKVNAGLVLLVLLISGVLRTLPPNP